MSMRVATFATSQRLLATTMRIQSKVSDMEMQQASGSVSTTYGGLGSSTKQVLDLESALAQSKSYSSAASEATNRVQVMYSTLSGITDLMTSFRSTLTSMMSSDADSTSLAGLSTTASGDMNELASLLNTNYEGRYLFAGNSTERAPVDLTGYTADASTASASYYTGDGGIAAVEVTRGQSVSYGITADNSAFEQAFRAMGAIAANSSPSTDELQSAYDLISSALDDASGVQAELSGKASAISRASDQQSDYQSQMTTAISSLKDADVTTIAVQLSTYQTQLEASYSAIAKMQSLSLSNYLK
jgi:flagellar hook-associated protein 3 FlgL